MIDGFQAAWQELITSRMEQVLTNKEYALQTESLSKELLDILEPHIKQLDQQSRTELRDSINDIVFRNVFFQTKLAYHQAFGDAFSFYYNNIIDPYKNYNDGIMNR